MESFVNIVIGFLFLTLLVSSVTIFMLRRGWIPNPWVKEDN